MPQPGFDTEVQNVQLQLLTHMLFRSVLMGSVRD